MNQSGPVRGHILAVDDQQPNLTLLTQMLESEGHIVRTAGTGLSALEAIDRHPARPAVRVGSLAGDPVVGDVVLSTIPAAAQTADLVSRCSDVPVVFDVVYDPWPTPLAASAADRVLVSGLDLLVHQAVLQFELFTGREAPLAAMRAAGEAVLGSR